MLLGRGAGGTARALINIGMASLATEQGILVSEAVNRPVCRLGTIRLGPLYGDLIVKFSPDGASLRSPLPYKARLRLVFE